MTTTRKLGRKTVTTYTPKNLVATLTLSAPPAANGTAYLLHAAMTSCDDGYLEFTYTPGQLVLGDGNLYVSGCGTDSTGLGVISETFDVAPVVTGSTITWTMPLSLMGKDLPLTTKFTAFHARVDIVDPLFGFGTNLAEILTSEAGIHASVDVADSDTTWKLG